jgi:hypothetical protein
MPLLMTPISELTMKMPPRVTNSMVKRKPVPSSPPMVPESSVRMRLSHAASKNPGAASAPPGRIPKRTTTRLANTIRLSDARPR